MKIELVNEHLVSSRVSKDFTIAIEGKGEIVVNKWASDNEHEMPEGDWEIVEGKEIYDKMSEEEQEEFDDFLIDVSLY